MDNRLKNDASSSINATIYQFYIALDKCFDLLEGEVVLIEKYGDITISDKYQIEVKQYQEDLTDLHENIWKTINNWLQPNFDISYYKNLILLTTQKFGVKSSFKEWNGKDNSQKRQILDNIAQKYHQKLQKSEDTEKLLKSVLDDTKEEKLLRLLDKFIICDSSASDNTYYEQLKQRRGKTVYPSNDNDYINSLMGYILSPDVRHSEGWKITYQDFTLKVASLISQFSSHTIIFPKKYMTQEVADNDIAQQREQLFVKKIEDIEHHAAKSKAITDYVRTNNTITQELKKYAIDPAHYKCYETEILDTYNPAFNKASRNTNKTDHIKDSKNFYDTMISSEVPQFVNFNDTPKFFRNGLLHNMANDEDKNIVWKLKVDEDG